MEVELEVWVGVGELELVRVMLGVPVGVGVLEAVKVEV